MVFQLVPEVCQPSDLQWLYEMRQVRTGARRFRGMKMRLARCGTRRSSYPETDKMASIS